MMAHAAPLFIGLIAGVCSGLFGIGGGIVIVPLLMFFMAFTIQQSAAISLGALLLPVGLLGVYAYWRANVLNASHLWIILLIDLGIIIGAYFGAKLALSLPVATLSKIFAVFLVLVAIRVWVKAG